MNFTILKKYKKFFFILICIMILLIIIIQISTIKQKNQFDVSNFSLTDYQWEIVAFESDKSVDPVTNVETAVIVANELWEEQWGTVNGMPYQPNPGKTVDVFFDSDENCWLIKGTPPWQAYFNNWTGALPHILIKTNGEIVAMWLG